jgi:hypothetical protein
MYIIVEFKKNERASSRTGEWRVLYLSFPQSQGSDLKEGVHMKSQP